ncbi:unnamed protein product, partial [Fusarium graminearum]
SYFGILTGIRGNGDNGVLVDGGYLDSFSRPIIFVILNDAETIDPDPFEAKIMSNLDCIRQSLWKLINREA